MEEPNEKIPLFRSWKQWYLVVIIFSVVLFIFFYLFTKTYS